MRKSLIPSLRTLIIALALVGSTTQSLQAEVQATVIPESKEAFTGKVTGNRVRLRLQPNRDGTIIKELGKGDLLLVVGEKDEYYTVRAPVGTKVYLFRTFVLENIVEGSRVNVRLGPDLDAPVVDQLERGTPINGVISSANKKWIEFDPPETTLFYVTKDYLEKVGDKEYLTQFQERREEAQRLLNIAYLVSQSELRKPFNNIHLDLIKEKFEGIIGHFSEYKEEVAKAKAALEQVEETYLERKLAYLETKVRNMPAEPIRIVTEIAPNPNEARVVQPVVVSPQAPMSDAPSMEQMRIWEPLEVMAYNKWLQSNDPLPLDDFYREELSQAQPLSGYLEPFNSAVKNRPGDYLLRDSNNLPIAYLYSTKVDLTELVGQSITLLGTSRPNNSFAFPAYFVHTIQ